MKQRTLFPVPRPKVEVDRQTAQLVKRTRLAFVRLCNLVDCSEDLELPKWFLKLVRRLRQDLSDLRNACDPSPAWQLRTAFLHATKAERRRRNRMNGSKHQRLRSAMLKSWNGRCSYCGRNLDEAEVTMDHLIPRAFDGRDRSDNIVPACIACNQAKRDRSPRHWARDILRVTQPPRRRWFGLRKAVSR